jgi:hypothetical protein
VQDRDVARRWRTRRVRPDVTQGASSLAPTTRDESLEYLDDFLVFFQALPEAHTEH